jgi:uncharacterized protein with NRDE domain
VIANSQGGSDCDTWQAGDVCTVVVRWGPGSPVSILALRDELVGRDFDDPNRWWPEHPDLVGGRDRQAGGTWCASRISTGVTALVLNRPDKRLADPGAPSRGVLPLLAAEHEEQWERQVEVTGMASFRLVLATPDRLTTWDFDGATLTAQHLEPGTHMVTSGGAEDGKAERYLSTFAGGDFPRDWLDVLRRTDPRDDPASLVVRHEHENDQHEHQIFATVFGEVLEGSPGRLRLQFARTPWGTHDWQRLNLS